MIWCLGMYASGSTWLFNAVREVAAEVRPATPAISCYAENLKMLAPVLTPGGVKIVKTHQLDARAEAFMNSQAGAILLTVRDPRDAVVSLMQHMRHSFFLALATVERSALFCQRYAADPRSRLLRYESGFIDEPRTFDMLAGICGGELSEDARARLFARSRRGAIEARIARLEELSTTVSDRRSGDVVDLVTQWHRHHAGRSGEVGRWRRLLSPDAVLIVEQRMGGWMKALGYETETMKTQTVSLGTIG